MTATDTRMTALAKLLPCPFCGNPCMDEDEGCFPVKRDRSVWIVRCGNPNCNAEVEDCDHASTVARWNRRASPAELGGVVAWCQADDPLSRTAFSWPGTARNPAHTTPLYATPRAAEAVIDDAMVERALSAMPIDVWNCDGADYMRAALTAALSPPSPGAAK